MTRKESTMIKLGTHLPDFSLENIYIDKISKIQSKRISNASLSSKPILLMFICPHCPFVKFIENQISKLDKEFNECVQIIAICSNSINTHPQDGPDFMKEQIINNNWTFPYILDQNQKLAKSLRAACTPDFYLFKTTIEQNIELVYRGQLDDSRPGNNIETTGIDLRSAIDCVLSNKNPTSNQKPSIGCNIKWHPGEEPEWFK